MLLPFRCLPSSLTPTSKVAICSRSLPDYDDYIYVILPPRSHFPSSLSLMYEELLVVVIKAINAYDVCQAMSENTYLSDHISVILNLIHHGFQNTALYAANRTNHEYFQKRQCQLQTIQIANILQAKQSRQVPQV